MDLFIIFAVTIDVTFAAMACGTSNIWIPWYSRMCMAAISSGFLIASAAGKNIIFHDLPAAQIKWIGFSALMLIGLMQILGDRISHCINQTKSKLLAPLRTGASIFLDHTKADQDHSKVLSPLESIILAIPVSIDSLIGGIGMTSKGITLVFLLMIGFLWNFFAVWFGRLLGTKLPIPNEKVRSMACGLALMALGVCKLFI